MTDTTSLSSTLSFFTQDEKPFGKSWSEWSELWWKWALSIPKSENAGVGVRTGPSMFSVDDDNDNDNDNVVFLVGAFDTPLTAGKQITHIIKIPAGKSILFPTINGIADLTQMTQDELNKWPEVELSRIAKTEVSINGSRVESQQVVSEVFDHYHIENNVFGYKPGPTKAISVGYWVFLKSIPPGEYDISTYGACATGKVTVAARYHITATDSDF